MTLSPDTIDAIAERVAEILLARLRPDALAGRYVDAGELAEILNVRRSWVYDHADELGAKRLVDGPKAAVRFDLRETLRRIEQRAAAGGPTPPQPVRRRRARPAGDRELLPIRGDRG